MKSKMGLLAFLVIMCLSASGCSRYIRSAVLIPNPDISHETTAIDIAVDFFGVKHIVRRVCSTTTSSDCQIVYSKATSGTTTDITAFSSPSGYIGMEHPVIAVTDSGVAAIAWDTARTTGGSLATLVVLSTALGSINEIDSGYVANTPHLVSKGNTIYAVQNVSQNIGGSLYSAIRYRQLVGGSASGWVSEHGVTRDNTYKDAAVSPSGNLYVVFWRNIFGDIMYADNYGTTGDMTNRFGLISSAYAYSEPRIDVNGIPEVVYITYTENFSPTPGFSDHLVIAHCPAASCSFPPVIELPLNPAKEWDVEGVTDIVADIGNTAYFTFLATNLDIAGDYDVFEGFFQSGLGSAVGNISNTSGVTEGTPTIGLMWSFIPVSGWVTGGDIYQYDAFPFSGNPIIPEYYSLRHVYHTGFTIFSDYDLACNADWGAGAWIEDQSSQQAYFIFNTYPGLLPLIKK